MAQRPEGLLTKCMSYLLIKINKDVWRGGYARLDHLSIGQHWSGLWHCCFHIFSTGITVCISCHTLLGSYPYIDCCVSCVSCIDTVVAFLADHNFATYIADFCAACMLGNSGPYPLQATRSPLAPLAWAWPQQWPVHGPMPIGLTPTPDCPVSYGLFAHFTPLSFPCLTLKIPFQKQMQILTVLTHRLR